MRHCVLVAGVVDARSIRSSAVPFLGQCTPELLPALQLLGQQGTVTCTEGHAAWRCFSPYLYPRCTCSPWWRLKVRTHSTRYTALACEHTHSAPSKTGDGDGTASRAGTHREQEGRKGEREEERGSHAGRVSECRRRKGWIRCGHASSLTCACTLLVCSCILCQVGTRCPTRIPVARLRMWLPVRFPT